MELDANRNERNELMLHSGERSTILKLLPLRSSDVSEDRLENEEGMSPCKLLELKSNTDRKGRTPSCGGKMESNAFLPKISDCRPPSWARVAGTGPDRLLSLISSQRRERSEWIEGLIFNPPEIKLDERLK